jgi:hypothetical protein
MGIKNQKKEKIMNIQFKSNLPSVGAIGRLTAGMRPLGSRRRLGLAFLALVVISQLTVGGSRVSAQTAECPDTGADGAESSPKLHCLFMTPL